MDEWWSLKQQLHKCCKTSTNKPQKSQSNNIFTHTNTQPLFTHKEQRQIKEKSNGFLIEWHSEQGIGLPLMEIRIKEMNSKNVNRLKL